MNCFFFVQTINNKDRIGIGIEENVKEKTHLFISGDNSMC